VKVTVLGSGQDGGLPQVGSNHSNDLAARDGSIPERTASSLLVEFADGLRLVLDVTPDFRVQWWRFDTLPDAVALTHAHMGHYAGLVHFGREAANAQMLPCFVTESMAQFLSHNAPWDQLVWNGNLEVRGGLRHRWDSHSIELVPVPHRAEYTDTAAISVDGHLIYLPDIDGWETWTECRSVIERHRVAFLDASFWSAGEIPGRPVAGIPHPLVTDTIERFAGIGTRIVLTHLNHTNPLCDPGSPETEQVLAAGFEIAHDGLTVVV
jgi:pyrroloquinoline quinone biosynthesis protein B